MISNLRLNNLFMAISFFLIIDKIKEIELDKFEIENSFNVYARIKHNYLVIFI